MGGDEFKGWLGNKGVENTLDSEALELLRKRTLVLGESDPEASDLEESEPPKMSRKDTMDYQELVKKVKRSNYFRKKSLFQDLESSTCI